MPLDLLSARVDAWLWAVRVFKSRTEATAACRGGHVRVGRAPAKASTLVKIGDRVHVFAGRERVLEVVRVIDKRVGAVVAATCMVDHSPSVRPQQRARAPARPRGAGRPTKRERRALERLRGSFDMR